MKYLFLVNSIVITVKIALLKQALQEFSQNNFWFSRKFRGILFLRISQNCIILFSLILLQFRKIKK